MFFPPNSQKTLEFLFSNYATVSCSYLILFNACLGHWSQTLHHRIIQNPTARLQNTQTFFSAKFSSVPNRHCARCWGHLMGAQHPIIWFRVYCHECRKSITASAVSCKQLDASVQELYCTWSRHTGHMERQIHPNLSTASTNQMSEYEWIRYHNFNQSFRGKASVNRIRYPKDCWRRSKETYISLTGPVWKHQYHIKDSMNITLHTSIRPIYQPDHLIRWYLAVFWLSALGQLTWVFVSTFASCKFYSYLCQWIINNLCYCFWVA